MSVFDCIIIILLAISALFGFRKGFIMQIFGLLAILLGVFCAFKFSGLVSGWLVNWIDTEKTGLAVTSFIITMLLVVVAIILIGRILTAIFKVAALGLFNRLLGMLFASAQTFFILSVIVYSLSFLKLSDNNSFTESLQNSKFYNPMKRTVEVVFPYINFNTIKEIVVI